MSATIMTSSSSARGPQTPEPGRRYDPMAGRGSSGTVCEVASDSDLSLFHQALPLKFNPQTQLKFNPQTQGRA
eukprot:758444-Hanusia_phi.AAC.4